MYFGSIGCCASQSVSMVLIVRNTILYFSCFCEGNKKNSMHVPKCVCVRTHHHYHLSLLNTRLNFVSCLHNDFVYKTSCNHKLVRGAIDHDSFLGFLSDMAMPPIIKKQMYLWEFEGLVYNFALSLESLFPSTHYSVHYMQIWVCLY